MIDKLSKILNNIPLPQKIKRFIHKPAKRLRKTKIISYASNVVHRHLRPESFVLSDQTPCQIIASSGLMSVRYYPPLQQSFISVEGESVPVNAHAHEVPILLVPPLGVSAWIFDLLQERSLVKYLLAHGYTVFLVDWGEPDRSHAHLSLENYVLEWLPEAVAAAKAFSESIVGTREISMLGYCMGGLLTLMHAANAEDPEIKNIVTVASPIDFHASNRHGKLMKLISRPLNDFSRMTRFSLSQLNPLIFHTSGEKLSWLFKLTNPLSNVTSYFDLLINMADKDYVATHMTMSRWFNEMLDYPGATMQNILAKMWLDNQMAKGYVGLGVNTVDLSAVTANFLALAGSNDRIVGIRAARRVLDIISSQDRSFEVVPGGHAGVFAGGSAPKNTWKSIVTWLERRSGSD